MRAAAGRLRPSSMDAAYAARHIEEDRLHWWFRGRLEVLLAVLRATLPPPPLRLLELGCGTGNVLAALGRFGQAVGMEPNPELAAVGRAAGLDIRAGALPDDLVVPDGWADVVLLLDVLEHVDDRAALAAARRALTGGGHLVVTVPAYAWLWGPHDVALGHRRRYTARGLRRLVEASGLAVERLTYFNTLLFPAVAAGRLWKRFSGDRRPDIARLPAGLDRLLAATFVAERHLVPRVRLPFGGSLLAIARRPPVDQGP